MSGIRQLDKIRSYQTIRELDSQETLYFRSCQIARCLDNLCPIVCQTISDNLKQLDNQVVYHPGPVRWSDGQTDRQTCVPVSVRHSDNQAICHPVPVRPSDGQTVCVLDYVRLQSDNQAICHPVPVRQSEG